MRKCRNTQTRYGSVGWDRIRKISIVVFRRFNRRSNKIGPTSNYRCPEQKGWHARPLITTHINIGEYHRLDFGDLHSGDSGRIVKIVWHRRIINHSTVSRAELNTLECYNSIVYGFKTDPPSDRKDSRELIRWNILTIGQTVSVINISFSSIDKLKTTSSNESSLPWIIRLYRNANRLQTQDEMLTISLIHASMNSRVFVFWFFAQIRRLS